MEKYGFVYIWYDKKRKLYYIGSHWGTEDDGYICSSHIMRKAYRRRPKDFKRRVLRIVKTSRKDLFEAEQYFFDKIIEKNKMHLYYNICFNIKDHWSSDSDKRLTVSEKIKKNHNTPEMKKKFSEAKLGNKNPMKNPEVSKRVADKNRGRVAPNKGIPQTEEQKKQQSITMKTKYETGEINIWNKGKKFTDEEKKNIIIANKKMALEKTWYYNEKTKQMIRINNYEKPPAGFKKGRLSFKHSEETKKKIGNSRRGIPQTKKYGWITNEIEDKKILQGLPIPDGWKQGRKKKCT